MAFKCKRWTIDNILRVAFVLGVIVTICTLYLWLHVLPLLIGDAGRSICGERHEPIEACISTAFQYGLVDVFVQQALTGLLLVCFGRAIFTDPGSVPDEPAWHFVLRRSSMSTRDDPGLPSEGDGATLADAPKPHEVKQTGARRFCKWCNRYKPDRSHHCRLCRSCILRMDHHCPWIANCVGFQNHKYFFLFVLYSLLDGFFVLVTGSSSLYRSFLDYGEFSYPFLLVFYMTIFIMMNVLLMFFLMFHVWLMMTATTTIEFCEKRCSHSGCSHRGSTKSIYDVGCLENIRAVLGRNMLFWLLPFDPPEGSGLTFRVFEDDLKEGANAETTPLLTRFDGSAIGSENQLVGHIPEYQACARNNDAVNVTNNVGSSEPVERVADFI